MRILAAIVIALALAAPASAQSPTRTQQELRVLLRSADPEARASAAHSAAAIAADSLEPALRAALIEELVAEGRAYFVRSTGNPAAPRLENERADALGPLMRAVGSMRDPAAIPALAGVLGNGFAAVRALADFGEAAVPEVLRIASASTAPHEAVDHALITLRFMVESEAVSPRTRSEIISLTTSILQTPGHYFTTYWYAIDLASVLGPFTRALVERVLTTRGWLESMGTADRELSELTRQRARKRLAGELPLPRR